jgi:hypothetical protein
VSNRQQQIRLIVEQTLNEGDRLSSFMVGMRGEDPVSLSTERHKLQRSYDDLLARDPGHPALADIQKKMDTLSSQSHAASKHKLSRFGGAAVRGTARGAWAVLKKLGVGEDINRGIGLIRGAGVQSVGIGKGLGVGAGGGSQGEAEARLYR